MKISFKPAPPDVTAAKRAASALLRTDGMRLHLIWATLLCLTLGGGSLYLVESIFAVIPWARLHATAPLLFRAVNALYTLTDIAYTVLVIFPLIHGAAHIFFAAAHGQKLPLSALFCAFDNARAYRRAVAVTTVIALPRVLLFFALRALCHVALSAASPLAAVLWWGLALALLGGACWILGLDDALLPLALGGCPLGVFRMYRISVRLTAPRLWRIWHFKLSYLLWGLASVLTLGVVWTAHALPHYTLAHTAWTDGVYRMDNSIAPRGKSI